MIERTDPYAVLGLTPHATQEQIRRAYRALLRQNHPDTHPWGEPADKAASNTTLQQVIAAYAIIGDPAHRAAYDHDTSPHQIRLRTRVRLPMPFCSNESDQPPIQAGPVHWHASSR
ncbi:J domain-containing protein [Phycicoccus sp. Soil802]|uniref:J domain-containing protein n=1 Tax=Phycicoccus sp. Soil802 TaxID=1736414 RepID=UPI000702DC2C|nr:J domain-containing protein [Phycicoccus sp. Soil802]KRF28991.1 hypothetical protein ASG91_05060 [Phycicoccus sp. Soil802]